MTTPPPCPTTPGFSLFPPSTSWGEHQSCSPSPTHAGAGGETATVISTVSPSRTRVMVTSTQVVLSPLPQSPRRTHSCAEERAARKFAPSTTSVDTPSENLNFIICLSFLLFPESPGGLSDVLRRPNPRTNRLLCLQLFSFIFTHACNSLSPSHIPHKIFSLHPTKIQSTSGTTCGTNRIPIHATPYPAATYITHYLIRRHFRGVIRGCPWLSINAQTRWYH